MSAASVSQWRIFCNTENAWVEYWSVAQILLCPNNNAHSVNTNSIQLLQTINSKATKITNMYQDPLESLRVIEQTTIIDLKSFHGLSIENIVSSAGNATISSVSETDSEIKLYINGTSDSCGMRSAERGYYIAGLSSECGIAVRIPAVLDTSHQLKFGYYDDNNGYYFKLVGSTINVGVMHYGTEILINRNQFNRDKLDGSGTGGVVLDLTKGNIFRIDFTWYGFGQVIFGCIQTDNANNQAFIPMHVYTTDSKTSCGNPCLPINVKLSSNGSAVAKSVYVAGRQYSILGKPTDANHNNTYYINEATSSSTAINPLFSIQHKSNYITCPVRIISIRAISSVNAKILIIKNSALTGSNFQNNAYVEESCVLVDTAATISGGITQKNQLLFANQPITINMNLGIYESDTTTLAWQTFGNTGTLSIQVEWTERF